MEQLGVVTENNERGGRNSDLRHVIDLKTLTLVCGRLNLCCRFIKHIVEHTRGDSENRLTVDVVDMLKEICNSLTGLCRYEDDRSVRHISESYTDLVGKLFDRGVVFFNGIPFVYNDYRGLSRLVSDTCDLFVLLGDTRSGVDHKKANVSTLNSRVCAKNGVFLDNVIDLCLAANTCGVDKRVFSVRVFNPRVDSVTGRSRDI